MMFFIASFNINSEKTLRVKSVELSFNFLHSAYFQRGPACFVRFIKCTYCRSAFFWTSYSFISESGIILLNRNIKEFFQPSFTNIHEIISFELSCAPSVNTSGPFENSRPPLNWIPYSYYLNRSIYISRQTNERAVLNQVI